MNHFNHFLAFALATAGLALAQPSPTRPAAAAPANNPARAQDIMSDAEIQNAGGSVGAMHVAA